MHKPIDQHTDVDKRIRDFMDRKASPWRAFSDKIAERLAPTVRTGSASGEEITYEAIKWTSATPHHS